MVSHRAILLRDLELFRSLGSVRSLALGRSLFGGWSLPFRGGRPFERGEAIFEGIEDGLVLVIGPLLEDFQNDQRLFDRQQLQGEIHVLAIFGLARTGQRPGMNAIDFVLGSSALNFDVGQLLVEACGDILENFFGLPFGGLDQEDSDTPSAVARLPFASWVQSAGAVYFTPTSSRVTSFPAPASPAGDAEATGEGLALIAGAGVVAAGAGEADMGAAEVVGAGGLLAQPPNNRVAMVMENRIDFRIRPCCRSKGQILPDARILMKDLRQRGPC